MAAKWHLLDEDLILQAGELLQRFVNGTQGLAAPALIRYEVGNALELARRSGRIDAREVAFQLARFLELATHHPTDDDDLVVAASAIAAEYGIEIYDGVYLALSRRLSFPLVTADARLYKRVGDLVPDLVWLGDIEIPA